MRVVLLAALLLSSAPALAQQATPAPASTPAPLLLVGASMQDVPSQRLAKHVVTELSRRGIGILSETEAKRLLGRPATEAVAECGGDELCWVALGQVVSATQVIAVTAAPVADTTKYDCSFRSVDVRAARGRPPLRFVTLATDQGLIAVARHVVEQLFPRPAMVAVGTPTPTPTAGVAPVATPALTPVDEPLVLVEDPPEMTAAAPPSVTRPRSRSRGRNPMPWGAVAAGALLLGAGAFLGAEAMQTEQEEKEGTSTMEVRF